MRTQNISSLEALNENALIGAEPVKNFCVKTNQLSQITRIISLALSKIRKELFLLPALAQILAN